MGLLDSDGQQRRLLAYLSLSVSRDVRRVTRMREKRRRDARCSLENSESRSEL